jgi:uncharacterized protein YciI
MLFIVSGIDKPNGLEHRLAVRSRHRAYYESLGKDLILSGPYLNENGDPIGSMIVVRAEDLTAAETFARADPFYLEHVFAALTIRRWDWFMNRPEGFVS